MRRTHSFPLCADFGALPLRDASISLIWSVLALGWAVDLPAVFREWHRVLETGGLVLFATYGPDTLKELRAAFAAAGETSRVHAFPDMHDLGDMLVEAGYADPVMEAEWITLTYEDLDKLACDLRAWGVVNVRADRPRGLLTPRRWHTVGLRYEQMRTSARLPATFEIVYGHAWKAAPRRLADGRAIVRFDPGAKRRAS